MMQFTKSFLLTKRWFQFFKGTSKKIVPLLKCISVVWLRNCKKLLIDRLSLVYFLELSWGDVLCITYTYIQNSDPRVQF